MEKLTPREAELLGESAAYRMAFLAAITAHPYAHLLHGRIQTAREQGVVAALGEPVPDQVLASFERAMDEIAAKLPARPPTAEA